MRYELYYRENMIATVEQEDADFPTFFGHYRLEPGIDAEAPALAHVRAYVDYSVRVWPLIEQDRFDDPAMAEEETFTDLIESPDWWLVETETQKRFPILIPVFCSDGGINWRLNPNLKDEPA